MKIGLISHLIRDYNLGCSALAISNLKLMDEIFKEYDVDVEYVVILAEPKEKIELDKFTSLKGFTNNQFTYRTYPRLKAILKKPILLKKIHTFEDLDYVIDLCGGDGYTDNYGIIRLLAESLPVYASRMKKTKILFAPQTIGPFNTHIGKVIAKSTLKKLEKIYARDRKSYECCCSLGLEKKTTQVIDVAFALPYEKIKQNNDKFNIGINISGLLYNGGYNQNNYFKLSFSYKNFIEKLIEKLIKDEECKVHLIAHVIDNDNIDDDYSACIEINKKYPETVLAPRFKSASEAKGYISSMQLFSGARMHATIAATSSGVPVIPVAYSRKFNGLYDTLKYKYYIDAKANLTEDEAIELFMKYKSQIDKLKRDLGSAKEVYTTGLEKYKNSLKELFEL